MWWMPSRRMAHPPNVSAAGRSLRRSLDSYPPTGCAAPAGEGPVVAPARRPADRTGPRTRLLRARPGHPSVQTGRRRAMRGPRGPGTTPEATRDGTAATARAPARARHRPPERALPGGLPVRRPQGDAAAPGAAPAAGAPRAARDGARGLEPPLQGRAVRLAQHALPRARAPAGGPPAQAADAGAHRGARDAARRRAVARRAGGGRGPPRRVRRRAGGGAPPLPLGRPVDDGALLRGQ